MMKPLLAVVLAVLLAASPAAASEKKKPKAKKPETGASCKAPAVGRCAACSITCPPGEAATCGSGVMMADVCHTQPVCKCAR